MSDMILKCQDCGANFTFTEKDQKFFESKGFTPPKRCKPCRDKKKQATKSQGN
jgi:DNA replicative helicase MCM subunit Mcm2 (Cdc46/Mcm family)